MYCCRKGHSIVGNGDVLRLIEPSPLSVHMPSDTVSTVSTVAPLLELLVPVVDPHGDIARGRDFHTAGLPAGLLGRFSNVN